MDLAHVLICMSMPAIIEKDIYLFAGQIIYAVLYGVTSAAYVLLTTLVGLLSWWQSYDTYIANVMW